MTSPRTDRELTGKFLTEFGAPSSHRSAVIAVEADPASPTAGAPSTGIDLGQAEQLRFDITLTGVGFTSLDVTILFFNVTLDAWFRGQTVTLTSTGRHALEVPEARDATVFLLVTAFVGVSFSLDADFVVS